MNGDGEKEGKPQAVPGPGDVPWSDLIVSLKDSGFSGYVIYEGFREGGTKDLKEFGEELRKSRQWIEKAFA